MRIHAIFTWTLILSHHLANAPRPTPGDAVYQSLNSSLNENGTGFATHEPGAEEFISENNITCVGDLPDLRLPLLEDGFNPNGANMQTLCAKPQYGGGRPREHAGGYCWTRPGTASYNSPDNNTTGDVGFDLSRAARASSQLQNPRFLLACFYRCFCNYGLANPSVQPKSKYSFFHTSITRSIYSYELQLDRNNDFTTPSLLKRGRQGLQWVRSVRVPERSELDQTSSPNGRLGQQYLSLDRRNEIECRGDLPDFVLPVPYAKSDFRSLQELCATQMNGGNMYTNAGGYCHQSAAPSNTVWFSDDQTPRLEWTWAGGNFFASASIRFLCWRRCACRNAKPTKDNATLALWAFVHGHALALRPSGAVVIQPVPFDSMQETQVLPPQNGSNPPSGTCGPSGKEFCPQAWPSDIYGEVPRVPPDVTDVPKMGECGNFCSGPDDCSSTGCSCALPSIDDAKAMGLDPVAPVAVCLAVFATSLKGSTIGGKRAADKIATHAPYVDIRGVPHTCRCNATFKADQCCSSKDGLIWQ